MSREIFCDKIAVFIKFYRKNNNLQKGLSMYKVDFTKPCHAHFIGIGGVSMSGLAEILNKEGFKVSGSDASESATTKHLSDMGIEVKIGQVADNITDDISFVVYTAAIRPENPEFQAAVNAGIPMLTRAEFLGQIMDNYKYSIAVAGTHGKTTTTSMLAHVLLAADTDPTISIGGNLQIINGNIRVGSSDYFVTEACEYTNSYHSFKPYISIILNIDNDHMDFFKTMENVVASFSKFATLTLPGGVVIMNGDSPYLPQIKEAAHEKNIRLITFGLGEDNDYRAVNITLDDFGHPSYDLYVDGKYQSTINLAATGQHNAANSLAVIAAAHFIDIADDAIKEGLKSCHSADRRFQNVGTYKGELELIDDYAHHPTEIEATLKAAKEIAKGDVWVAFQPHTYSRTKAHLKDFARVLSIADHVLLADIYAAREPFDETISARDIETEIKKLGSEAIYMGDFESIKNYIKNNYANNDMLISMGAGNINEVCKELASE